MDNKDKSRIVKALGETKENDRYYVYMLCEKKGDSFIPFYIGKGEGQRMWQHEEDEKKAQEDEKKAQEDEKKAQEDREKQVNRELKDIMGLTAEEKEKIKKQISDDFKNESAAKFSRIREIKDNGGEVKKVIVKWGLTENEAFMVESALMNMYYFINQSNYQENSEKYKKKEPVVLTNIVNGHASRRELNSRTHDTKALLDSDFLREQAPKEVCMSEIEENVLFIKINDLYPKCRNNFDIYNACRALWTISEEKTKDIDFVFAIYNTKIVGIFRPLKWYRFNNDNYDITDIYPLGPNDNERKQELECYSIAKKGHWNLDNLSSDEKKIIEDWLSGKSFGKRIKKLLFVSKEFDKNGEIDGFDDEELETLRKKYIDNSTVVYISEVNIPKEAKRFYNDSQQTVFYNFNHRYFTHTKKYPIFGNVTKDNFYLFDSDKKAYTKKGSNSKNTQLQKSSDKIVEFCSIKEILDKYKYGDKVELDNRDKLEISKNAYGDTYIVKDSSQESISYFGLTIISPLK